MSILFIGTYSYLRWGIEETLKKLNIQYDVCDYDFSDLEKDDKFCELLDKKMLIEKYELVFSVNFFPLVSIVCMSRQVKYYSWVHDNPLHIRNQELLLNDCNEMFFSDRQQAAEYAAVGVNAHHLPPAVSTMVFDHVMVYGNKADTDKYKADLSLISHAYETAYNEYASTLAPYLKGYLEGIIEAQSKLYGAYIINELVNDGLIAAVNASYTDKNRDGQKTCGGVLNNEELEYTLACEVTNREQRKVISVLAQDCDVALYDYDLFNVVNGVRQEGKIDYITRVPLISRNSKINLNVSFKMIKSGIPLSVLDIMACGGFVLTNYQEEIAEYLAPGNACAMYESIEDMREKALFYLTHEDERIQIAARGRELVEQQFTFESRIKEMFGKILHF